MTTINATRFDQGNEAPQNPGDPAPNFDFKVFEARTDILLIMTVDKNGLVTIHNHPNSPEKLHNIDHLVPYPTGALYDTYNLTMAIYADATDSAIRHLGAWNPGPPKRCYT